MPTSKQKQYETTESKLQPLQPCAITTLWLMNDPLHRNNLAFEVVMGHSSARYGPFTIDSESIISQNEVTLNMAPLSSQI